MLTADQRREFELAGYVRLPAAVPTDAVASMRHQSWEFLARQGVRADDPSTWRVPWSASSATGTVHKLKGMSSAGHSPEGSSVIREALDAVFDPHERDHKADWGQPLVTLVVDAPAWLVPRHVWHCDHLYPSPRMITGVNVFLLMADVVPGGGGTAVVRNSPLLMEQILRRGARFEKLSDQNKGFLSAYEWTRGLKVRAKEWTVERNTTYMNDTDVDGVAVRVDELCGSAGDVFLCHPALVHAPAMNVSDQPRFMRVQRFYAQPPEPFQA